MTICRALASAFLFCSAAGSACLEQRDYVQREFMRLLIDNVIYFSNNGFAWDGYTIDYPKFFNSYAPEIVATAAVIDLMQHATF